ncbi:UNVERIFIED_CONTAM: hypothetical protein PYX00_007661 [Menopon gallinae]|uniref:EGF-like domain-containing protein n=1 Tax=Menopon gallinae TaxID=328185 RepID=A0AAW2HJV0_9NEOP
MPGYTGRDCATDIDECLSNPCRNGGECVDLVDGYRCICPIGYSGNECEIDRDHCNPNPCQNNAPCFNTQSDYYCRCSENWVGKNCSMPRIKCANPPCNVFDGCSIPISSGSNISGPLMVSSGVCGGHGRCVGQSGGGFRCVCDPGYTGKYCHENINDCKMNPCQNGGTCVDKVHSFQCICEEGWEGDLCSIEKNECDPNPCRNNGTCTDAIADFKCTCKDGWKGKICSLLDSHCDRYTCRNGGTCQDLGNTFMCKCAPGWEGTTCHIAKTNLCKSNPCLNGGTCLNTGDYYTCICKEGFKGQNCQHDIDDCAQQPCLNGGRCVDGVNWYLCECANGFAGPDCRINVNECASGPCAYGATCVDGIGEFTCICPPGRTGTRCDLVEELAYARDSCFWEGRYFADNSTWMVNCNTCGCSSGVVSCTQVWCGAGNCLSSNPRAIDAVACNPNQVCVTSPRETCLSPVCAPWGECRDFETNRRVGPPSFPTPVTCWPNQAVLSNSCARLTLIVERSRLSTGVTTEILCMDLRRLTVAHQALIRAQDPLVLLCDLKQGYNDTLEVTVSLSKNSPSEARIIAEAVRVLGESISRKASALSLAAIVEVKVETALISEEKQGNGYMIALVCVVVIILAAAALALLFYWHQLRRDVVHMSSGVLSDSCSRHHDDEKSNNLQNEENLRRYTNPLRDESLSSLGGSLANLGSLRNAKGYLMKPSVSSMDLTPRVSLVRPISQLGQSHSSSEMLEMISEKEGKCDKKFEEKDTEKLCVKEKLSLEERLTAAEKLALEERLGHLAGTSSHHSSQTLLFKPQNAEVRNNTAGTFDDAVAHKDFAKRIINLKNATAAPAPRTLQQPSPQVDRGGPGDELTILV